MLQNGSKTGNNEKEQNGKRKGKESCHQSRKRALWIMNVTPQGRGRKSTRKRGIMEGFLC